MAPSAPGSEASSATAGDPEQRPFPDEQVHDLARTFTRQSQRSTGKAAGPQTPFDRAEGTELDPASPNFSARAWTEAALRMQSEDPNNPARRAGIAFRDISAYGYGSATDYQTTVSSAPLQLQGLVSRLAGNKGQRIDILHDMDGLVRSGEMLVVLGPPGR